MASEELVTEQFQFLGIEVQKDVLSKCVSLCDEYGIDAESFTEQWMAFSLNHLNGASPDIDNLDLFARKEFSKRAVNRHKTSSADTVAGAGLSVYGAPATLQPDNEVLSNYMAVAPKMVKVEIESNNQSEPCPAFFSTIVSAKYASRTNAGAVVHSYGDEKLLQKIAEPAGANLVDFTVTQVPNDDGDLYTKAMFGFELLHEKASILDNHIRYLSQCIMKKAGITEITSVRHKTQDEVCVAGRIECDADARLNPKCVVLQGTWEHSLSQAVPVDLDNVSQYSLFPGQVVVMRGVNPRGDRFTPRQVYSDAAINVDYTRDIHSLTGTISLLIASGPFTTSDNLSYEPLKDLVTYIASHKPHVVILTGPFVDSDHAKVKDHTMTETFRSLFDKLVDSLEELNATCPNTKIHIVSSAKDAFHSNVYPTPPYPARRKWPNIQMLPDPCTLQVAGVAVAVTSCDVLMAISQEEISFGVSGDKFSRLAGHVLSQQCFWPLPAGVGPPGAGPPHDAALWAAHAQINTPPQLLILPSNFRYFVKEVNGCVVINPEHVTKGAGGGTFARVMLTTGAEKVNVAAQILRI